jgi:hypothetical protein
MRGSRRWTYHLRAPMAIADDVLDVALGDVRVSSARGLGRVRINLWRADESEPWPGTVGQGEER